MSQRTKSSGRSLAEQSKRGKVVGKKIVSKSKETEAVRPPNENRMIKLGVVELVQSLFDEKDVDQVLEFAYGYADYLFKYESIFEYKYLLEVLLESLASMSDNLDEAIEYINSITMTELILTYQTQSYLGDHDSTQAIEYVSSRLDYFDPNTFEGKTRLVEFAEYFHENEGDISALTVETDFEFDIPTRAMQILKHFVTECQMSDSTNKGVVSNLGYCTECDINLLELEISQVRCADEPMSVFVTCSRCKQRGGNIKYYADDEGEEKSQD